MLTRVRFEIVHSQLQVLAFQTAGTVFTLAFVTFVNLQIIMVDVGELEKGVTQLMERHGSVNEGREE